MKTIKLKGLIFILILSAISLAQERTYIELTPNITWGSAGSIFIMQRDLDKPVVFSWSAAINLPITNSITIKPYVSLTADKWFVNDKLAMYENAWGCGATIKIYIKEN